MPKSEDRRAQPRASLESPAVAFLADQRVDCRAVDISIGGIALWSPVTREPGQFLRVNFSLAPPGGIPRWYDADGVVVRVGARPSGVLLGVQFVVIEDRVADDIHGYVAELLARDVARKAAQPAAHSAAKPAAYPMPDALNPPPFTGEFYPPEPRGYEPPPLEAARRRRTAEYGTTETPRVEDTGARPVPTGPDATRPVPTRPDATRPDATRPDATRPSGTAIPRTRVAAPAAAAPVAMESELETKRELERLFRAALSEVDATAGGRKDRRGK